MDELKGAEVGDGALGAARRFSNAVDAEGIGSPSDDRLRFSALQLSSRPPRESRRQKRTVGCGGGQEIGHLGSSGSPEARPSIRSAFLT
ncbi:MAG TPA: hypothetical protein VJT75_11785 [Thermoleophilaceae bacterium]|nr:hypothetical protein [Thermoleophilaceae bacterium]